MEGEIYFFQRSRKARAFIVSMRYDENLPDEYFDQDPADEAVIYAQPCVFTGETGDTKITVTADPGAFPDGATMRVSEVEVESYMDAVSGVVSGSLRAVKALDITFFDADGAEYTRFLVRGIKPSAPSASYCVIHLL